MLNSVTQSISGQPYESPSIETVEIEVEQPVFTGSGLEIPGYTERPGI